MEAVAGLAHAVAGFPLRGHLWEGQAAGSVRKQKTL